LFIYKYFNLIDLNLISSRSVFLLIISIFLTSCAKRGRPSGGVKDSIPPIVIKSLPHNLNTEFKSKKFILDFDEFIQLKDVGQQLVVSPPLKYPVIIKPTLKATKHLEVSIQDTLYDNTTYTFNFGQSIVDFNEGNPASFLNYTFSTGAYIDSLSLRGGIEDSYANKPDNFVSVMLYAADSTYSDSIVFKQQPRYITNTLDSLTTFKINYLHEGQYYLVALKDLNKDNKFDPLFEKIGFLANPINIPSDENITLKLFKEVAPTRVLSAKQESQNKILFGYQGDIDKVKLSLITPVSDDFKSLILKVPNKDSLYYWFKSPKLDSLKFTSPYDEKGIIDTFLIKTRKLPIDSLIVSIKDRKNMPLTEPVSILASTPIVEFDKRKILLLDKDTLRVDFIPLLDTIENSLKLNFPIEAEQNYRVQLFPGALIDLMNNTNDSIQFRISIDELESFGRANIIIDSSLNSEQIIVELLDKDLNVVRSIIGDRSRKYTFDFIEPGTYFLRIIEDENKNGRWDTGIYLKKKEPEKVHYYPELLKIRSNWEVEYRF